MTGFEKAADNSSRCVRPALDLLMSGFYPGALAPEHAEDLAKSGLTEATIRLHKIMSVPPTMIRQLLGFDVTQVRHAYLIPFPDPRGGWLDHIRMRVFPTHKDNQGRTVKYLGPRGAGPRLFFPIPTMEATFRGSAPLYVGEGCKKGLALAQCGFAVVGIEGIEAWHTRGSYELLPDFDLIPLQGRVVELVPDGDVSTNDNVERGARRLAEALERRGARVRLVRLPLVVAA